MKKERGAITILTLTTVLFMLAFLISTFTIIANRRQAQAEIKTQTIETYQAEVDNIEQIYDDYFAEEGSTIPISTTEQLLNIGSGKYIISNNKIYKYDADANYQLQNDISFSVADYLDAYPNAFEEKTWTETVPGTTVTNQVTNYTTANSTSDPYYTYIAPGTGTYKLEVWGASGGHAYSDTGGAIGGYSIGTVTLNQGDTIYVYVGEKGGYQTTSTSVKVTNGYNGGGGASKLGRNWWRCKRH